MLRPLLHTIFSKVLLAILSCFGLLAGIRPSLDLNLCSWNATDILIVTATPQNGKFRVVETIKGDTEPNTILKLDGLIPRDGITSTLSELAARYGDPFSSRPPFEAAPPIRLNDRVIVFLRRPGAPLEFDPRPDLPVSTDGWQPANWHGDLRVSAVWLQDGVAYGFAQTVNPGPSHLVDLGWGETRIREEIGAVLRLRRSLDEALALEDPVRRAKQLAALVRSSNPVASGSALRQLQNGGAAAAESLQELLADQSLLPQHAAIIEALVKTGVRNLDFSQLLKREIQYWGEACRALQPDWWIGSPYAEVETPKSHYGRLYAALKGIGELHLERDLPAVRDLNAVWNTCPPLDDHEPLSRSQVSRECDLLLGAQNR